jgi:TatD DNase family protein
MRIDSQLIDSHCHLPHKYYKKSTEEVIKEAARSGVVKLINIGTSIKESKEALEIAEEFDNVFPTVAIYPHSDRKRSITSMEKNLRELLETGKFVAVGECGIDISNWKGGRSVENQLEIFELQAKLALEYDLPLIIHNRNGDKEVLEVLEKYSSQGLDQGLRGVVHCFDSDWEFAQKVLDLGFYISFSAFVTYRNKEALLEVVKNVPANKFLVETDAPYLPPQEYRGKPNYPKYVKIVAEKVAQVKEKPFEEVAKYSYENTCALFNL